MIVAKFGGTCITNINISKVKNIITDHHQFVVVSAMGKNSINDTKVTDLLIKLYNELPDISGWEPIALKYRKLVHYHAIQIDIDGILCDAISAIVERNDYCYTLSVGEELSAQVMSKYLSMQYLDAGRVLIFGNNGRIDYKSTVRALRATVVKGKRYCMAGFWGATAQGDRKLFDRGGGDISGAIVAGIIEGCCLYENWTDVNGVCIANPHIVDNVATVRCLSYDDMRLLSESGASVLHGDSIAPTRNSGIPISIRNIYNTANCGTMVTCVNNSRQILGITDKATAREVVTTIVLTLQLNQVLSAVLSSLSAHDITLRSLEASGNYIKITTDCRVVDVIYRHLLTCGLL